MTLKNEVFAEAGDKHLSRRPELAASISQFDLHQEIRLLRSQQSWQRETGRSSKTLVKQQDFRIVLVLMKPGTRISEHRVNARISIETVIGRLRIHFRNRQSVELSAGGLLALDFSIAYDVECLEESAFLISISWPKEYITWADDESVESL